MKRVFRSYAECEEQWRLKDRLYSINSLALHLVLHGRRDGWKRIGNYSVAVYGADRCDGGIVIFTFAPAGQKPHSSAYYAHDWASETIRTAHLWGDRKEAEVLSGLAMFVRETCYAAQRRDAAVA